MDYNLQSQIFSFISSCIVVIGFIYSWWKVYNSNFYKDAIEKEFEFRNDPFILEVIIRVGMWAVWSFAFAIVTVLVPLVIFFIFWGLIF